MSGEWTGWQEWKEWQEAGVFGTRLNFTDDDIITHQTINRTGSVIGKCRAMDAAVAFGLASAGPDGEVSVADLLTDNTRSAYVIESAKVGYGVFRNPDIASCGHDEVDNINIYRFLQPYSAVYDKESKELFVKVSSSHISDSFMLKYADVMTEEKRNNLSEGIRVDATLPPLVAYKELIEATFDIPSGCVGYKYSRNPTMVKQTKGVCSWAYTYDDVEGQQVKRICSHHDGARIKGWAMLTSDDGFTKLYESNRCQRGWNNNMLRNHFVDSSQWVRWETQIRSQTRLVDDKEVLKLITKSLGRMMKRVDNIVSKTGSHSTARYSWSDWGWLADITSYIRQTRSKNRKAGDVENGWCFTPVNIRKSYGMEISDFVWVPADQNDVRYFSYQLCHMVKPSYSWGSAQRKLDVDFSNAILYTTEEEAQRAGENLLESLTGRGGIIVRRVYTEGQFEAQPNYDLHIYSSTCNFVLQGSMEPNEYLTPSEVKQLALTAAPTVIDTHKENFVTWDIPIKTKTIKAPVEGEAEEVTA